MKRSERVKAWAIIFKADKDIEGGGGGCYVGQLWVFPDKDKAEKVRLMGYAADYEVTQVEIKILAPRRTKP